MKRKTGTLDDAGSAKELALYRLSVAKEDLSDAEQNFKDKRYRSANNRAYYAIFHAISACLALEFKAFKSHAQVIGNFNKEFVHSGKFPEEIGRKITHRKCETPVIILILYCFHHRRGKADGNGASSGRLGRSVSEGTMIIVRRLREETSRHRRAFHFAMLRTFRNGVVRVLCLGRSMVHGGRAADEIAAFMKEKCRRRL